MRILFVTPYITSEAHAQFMCNQTGFGYMVHDIAEYVAKREMVDLFTVSAFTKSMDIDGVHILGRNRIKWLFAIRLRNIRDAFRFLRCYKVPPRTKLKILYYYAALAQAEHIVSNYDIVHIHGCSPITDACVKICKRKKIPFLVTLHGLNSFDGNIIRLPAELKRYERDFLKQASRELWPVSFISTGNKQCALDYLKIDNIPSFDVVSNGCNTEGGGSEYSDIRPCYSIGSNDFVFAFIGNISKNKNQIQVARAYSLLPVQVRKHIKILFAGKFHQTDELVKYIYNNNLAGHLVLCGSVPKSEIHNYYTSSDATVLTSLTEGFGLSIIEGFSYGKPNLTFADLPAVPELYDKQAMIALRERSDEAVASGMQRIMQQHWDSKYIMKFAQNFSFEYMADKYIQLYSKIISWKHE